MLYRWRNTATNRVYKGYSRFRHIKKRRSWESTCMTLPIHPKAALASCLAMILSADNGTPAQPQRNVMGAARRDPRRGARPVSGASRRSAAALAPGRSVEQEQVSKFQKQGRLCANRAAPWIKASESTGRNLRFPML